MAKVYRAPINWVPDYKADWKAEQAREEAYIADIVALAKKNGSNPLLGEIYRVPRADGYAQYIVWRTSPLALVWLEIGDAWQMSEAEARGTRLADIKKQVDWERNWRMLTTKNKENA
jgi:hypothetical protein